MLVGGGDGHSQCGTKRWSISVSRGSAAYQILYCQEYIQLGNHVKRTTPSSTKLGFPLKANYICKELAMLSIVL